jgi:protein-disulfide isomerase
MSRLVRPVDASDHVCGPEGAPVTLLQYGDYQCPHCGRAHRFLKELLGRTGDRVRFVYRHFPLSHMHPQAMAAAQAAEAAAVQGRFWEMHDTLYDHQQALDPEHLLAYAQAIALDAARFEQELRVEVHLPKVRADFASGVQSGVSRTPTFFINGERFDMPWDDGLATALARAA